MSRALAAMGLIVLLVAGAGSLATPHQGSCAEVAAIAKEFASTHTYVEGSYDCDDMSITLANEFLFRGYNATLMLGNPLENITSMYRLNHAWVMVEVRGQWLAVESETGEVILADYRYWGERRLVGNFTGESTFLNYLYYQGWPVRVNDYWAWLAVHLNGDRLRPVAEQFYPVSTGASCAGGP
jgi:hypothetical protein